MPSLKEFVDSVLNENGLVADSEQIIKMITDIARERAIDNCSIISDEEVREMVINNVGLANKLAEEQRLRAEQVEKEEAERLAKKQAEDLAKKLEKERKTSNGEQTSLFGD